MAPWTPSGGARWRLAPAGTGRRRWLAGLGLVLALSGGGPAPAEVLFCAEARDPACGRAVKPARVAGSHSAMIVFAKFSGEAPGVDYPPSWAAALLDPTVPGSFAHFYQEMSGGLLRVSGSVLPRRYSSRAPAAAYLAASGTELGDFGRFNREILEQADAETDFGLFDNDGPDGRPNSGDDDGYVDIVFVNLLTVPRYFLLDRATGYASLNLESDYLSDDPAARGGVIRVRSRYGGFGGSTQRAHTFSVAAATMCHEFGHVLGLVDLFDQSTIGADGTLDPAEDSAGIGKWGLMGLGTEGWGVEDGPNAFCAWSLAKLGWVEVVDITADVADLIVPDALVGRRVYRIPLTQDEYFLLEGRQASGSYYNRNVPASGLLIWHVDERADNDEERHKRVDLVCADGLYADRGYPGAQPDPVAGGDNLDFYAKDGAYAAAHNGNAGDATDPFDGVRFTRFAYDTNPRAAAYTGLERNLPLGIEVDRIRRQGGDMLADVRLRRPGRGQITADTTWSGVVEVDGDVVVAPGARLVLAAGTEVRLASFDWDGTGFDASQCEILVFGELDVRGTASRPVRLLASSRRGRWAGLYLLDGQNPDLSGLLLEGATQGVVRLRLPAGQTRWSGSVRVPMDLVVPAAGELVVEPGTVVQFGLDGAARGASPRLTELVVEGVLRIGGTAAAPVVFTADSGVADALWYGVALGPQAQAEASYWRLERAGFGLIGRLEPGASLRVADSVIRQCAVSGLRLSLNGSASLSRTTLRWHRQQGIRVEGNGRLALEDVEVSDNGGEGILIGNASLHAAGLTVARNGVLEDAAPRSGVVASGGGEQSLRLERFAVTDNRRHGLELDGWEGTVELADGRVTANAGDGIRVYASSRLDAEGVAISDNAATGLAVRRAAAALAECSVAGNGAAGVSIGTGTTASIAHTEFSRGPGLVLEAADSATVRYCRFATGAVGLEARSTRALVRHNRFEGNQIALALRGLPPVPAPVDRNVFVDNVVAVDNQSLGTLQAAGNYWGTPDSAAIAALLRGPVQWLPFLVAEPDPTAVAPDGATPGRLALGVPYPNPFNSHVTVPFEVPAAGQVAVVLGDALGRTVARRLLTAAAAGAQKLVWDGRDAAGNEVASGVYFVRVEQGGQRVWCRVALVR